MSENTDIKTSVPIVPDVPKNTNRRRFLETAALGTVGAAAAIGSGIDATSRFAGRLDAARNELEKLRAPESDRNIAEQVKEAMKKGQPVNPADYKTKIS